MPLHILYSRVGIFWTAKKRQLGTDKQAALDCEYAPTDRAKYHPLDEPLTLAPPISVRAGRACKSIAMSTITGRTCFKKKIFDKFAFITVKNVLVKSEKPQLC